MDSAGVENKDIPLQMFVILQEKRRTTPKDDPEIIGTAPILVTKMELPLWFQQAELPPPRAWGTQFSP